MKKTIALLLLLLPGIGNAAIITDAIEIVGKILNSSSTANSTASVNFNSQIGDISGLFNGSASTSAVANVSGNSDSSSAASASWDLSFMTLKRANYVILWSFSDSVSSKSSGFADGNAKAGVTNLSTQLQNIVNNDFKQVSANSIVGSDSHSAADAKAGTLWLGLLAIGSVFDLKGSILSNAVASSGIFSSALSNASTTLTFTVEAVPEPNTIAIIMLGFVIMIEVMRRQMQLSNL